MKPLAQVALVGAGTGDADLITVRGLRYLQAAQVVLADALIDPAFKPLASQANWIDVGKRGFKQSCAQDDICRQLVLFAQCGLRVIRLKGGDPSLFARGEEEIALLKAARIEFEIVPGVSAAFAAAAASQRPLTRRGIGRSVTLQTAVFNRAGQALVAKEFPVGQQADSLVLYMVGQQVASIAQALKQQGWASDTAVLLVSNAGTSRQRMSEGSLGQLPALGANHQGAPTVLTVGVAATMVKPNSAALDALGNAPHLAAHPLHG